MKTLIIHPSDRSTDFLKVIYNNIENKTVITNGDKKDLKKLIKEHDRIMMMGHGCPVGLFSVGQFKNSQGLVIDSTFVELLETKECVFIWCNANEFVKKHKLKGFYSGMFISEVGEADYFNVKANKDTVEDSNMKFVNLFSQVTNRSLIDIAKHVITEYTRFGMMNDVAKYNSTRLYIL
jgi:hypothetical protein